MIRARAVNGGVESSRPMAADVRAAAARIAGHVHRTPVLRSRILDQQLGAEVFLKAENLQKVGAFKARGACNAVLRLDDERARRGVIAHSSGNHAAALAFAAGIRGIPSVVVMPDTAPTVKVDAVRGYGAEVVFCKQPERQQVCDRVAQERGMTLIHPFENHDVMAGAGTAALELIEEVGELDMVVVPVGGGGLAAGTTLITRDMLPRAEVVLAEPEAVDDTARSLETGTRQPATRDPQTWADGLLTGIGGVNFEILRDLGARVVTVSEDALVREGLFVLQRMKVVVEPSAATVLAALRAMPTEVAGRRVGVVLSGGNTDFRWISG